MNFRRAVGSQTDVDLYYLRLALATSRDTDDPKAKYEPSSAVGAVLVPEEGEVVASANRVPRRLRGKIAYRITDPAAPERYLKIEHAERAAIYVAAREGISTERATMYCTRFPCAACARAIVEVDIVRLVVGQGFSAETNWIEEQRAANSMLRDAGVTIRYLSP